MKYLIICIGNREGGDDALGPHISDIYRKETLDDIELLDVGVVPENFTGVIKQKNPEILFIIDAVDMNLPAGEIRFVPKEKIGVMHVSTHGIPLSVFINYLSQYINKIKLIGIQPKKMSGEMSIDVLDSCQKMVDIIMKKDFSLIESLK